MPTIIQAPTRIKAIGNKPKIIEEYIGNVNTSSGNISIAKMQSPGGWTEQGQTPEFDEYTLVLKGLLRIESKNETFDIKAGEAIITHKGEWVRYSTPTDEGAEYIAICLPAFTPDNAHRDE